MSHFRLSHQAKADLHAIAAYIGDRNLSAAGREVRRLRDKFALLGRNPLLGEMRNDEPAGISQNKLARDLDVPVTRIGDIIHGRRGISADSALRLGLYFGTTPEFWLNLQTRYDLKISKRDLLPTIAKNIRPLQEAS